MDTITFGNDTLMGKVGKVVYGNVSFPSDELVDLTIPLTKVKAIHTTTAFTAGRGLTKKKVAEQPLVSTSL